MKSKNHIATKETTGIGTTKELRGEKKESTASTSEITGDGIGNENRRETALCLNLEKKKGKSHRSPFFLKGKPTQGRREKRPGKIQKNGNLNKMSWAACPHP